MLSITVHLKEFCLCECAVSFTSAVLQISGSCLYFATLVLCLVVCVVPESCKFHERLKLVKAEI